MILRVFSERFKKTVYRFQTDISKQKYRKYLIFCIGFKTGIKNRNKKVHFYIGIKILQILLFYISSKINIENSLKDE